MAVAQVECSVRVSPTLARLIRKCAEQEASGASAIDALSAAFGVQPGEAAGLHKQLKEASKEAMQWRDKFALKRRELEELRTATASEEGQTRRKLRETTACLDAAQLHTRTLEAEIAALEARVADLAGTIEEREEQLAHSLSLSGLDDAATAALKALRHRLARGDVHFTNHSEADAMIANLSRPEMRSLNKMLTGRDVRLNFIRWLLPDNSFD